MGADGEGPSPLGLRDGQEIGVGGPKAAGGGDGMKQVSEVGGGQVGEGFVGE